MITLRTKTLVFLTISCGLGIGILSPLSDGLYSAMLLFCFPFLVASAGVAMGIASARTVMLKAGRYDVRVAPALTRGGAALVVSMVPQP